MEYNLNNNQDYSIIEKKIINKKYEYIIIGTGPAGVVLCNQILKHGPAKILLIDKGNHIKKKYEKVFYKFLPISKESKVSAIGGTSVVWSNITSYFEKFEMQRRWEQDKRNAWPLSYKELIKNYENLEKKYGFNYSKIKRNKKKFSLQLREFIANKKPVNFKKFINKNKIDLVYNCDISYVGEKNNESYIKFLFQKKLLTIFGKKIIVCCGGLESIKLIQKSINSKEINKVKNHNNIGKYFMEHPKFNLGYLRFPKINLINNLQLKSNKKIIRYYGLSLKPFIQRKFKVLNSYLRFEVTTNNYNDYENKSYNLLKYLFSKIFNKKNYFYRLRLFCEMKPKYNNTVEYLEKKGKILVNYKFDKIDINTIKILINNILENFSFHPNKEKIFNIKKINNILQDASHHLGGLTYLHDKNRTLVNKNLKLINTNNIYICSGAIFPTSGSANPTMTICALAIRLGNYLSKKINLNS
jgi:hypothetical protein